MTWIGRDEAAQRLGVGRDADEAQVERAFRRAARATHPDVGGDPDDFALILEARRLLLASRSSSAPAAVDIVTRRAMRARRWRRTTRRALARLPVVGATMRRSPGR